MLCNANGDHYHWWGVTICYYVMVRQDQSFCFFSTTVARAHLATYGTRKRDVAIWALAAVVLKIPETLILWVLFFVVVYHHIVVNSNTPPYDSDHHQHCRACHILKWRLAAGRTVPERHKWPIRMQRRRRWNQSPPTFVHVLGSIAAPSESDRS